jgi:hypothetical protein
MKKNRKLLQLGLEIANRLELLREGGVALTASWASLAPLVYI